MKFDINTIITQACHISRCSSWKLSSKARIAWAFIILVRIQQGEKQNRCHPKADYRLWQATHFSTKNPMNKPAMNKRTLCISFFTSSGKRQLKTSQVNSKLCQLQLSEKQLSRCCINFTHELTCQILTNQSIKIGRRAWPTCDQRVTMVKKGLPRLYF